ncbi:MAG TPA: glycoside hydrolase family 99-like domain-containing protein [Arenimonas sp.]|nr:glycoside hydrolase family 99-like domain-containing protein [Arenimonas sp.]
MNGQGRNADAAEAMVTIAIPAFNPRYFESALRSAMAQTFGDTEILVCDDSGDDVIASLVRHCQAESKFPIHYLRNTQRLRGQRNLDRCLREARGRYVKFLNDDDLLEPDCIATMVEVMESQPGISLVTSRRLLVGGDGELLPEIAATRCPFAEDMRVAGRDLVAYLIDHPTNFIGEPSTVLLRRADLLGVLPHICCINGQQIRAINDLAMYANLLRQGDLAYLVRPLSRFRKHGEQRQAQADVQRLFTASLPLFRAEAARFLDEEALAYDGRVATRPLAQPDADWTRQALGFPNLDATIARARGRVRRNANGIRAIAFHLPQFHAIAENDAWWGEGFTEWDNVRQGRPLFEGHNQPRVPTELGYYDLDDVEVLARQALLAREHGIEGFCFYYYWFDGKRLLERPVDRLLQNPQIELPFCLCWANENWTRRWDGGEREVLMRQSYAPELDERFALDAVPYLRDHRYIRVDGRPLFLVYRLDIIPDAARSIAKWREVWRREGIGEVYLVGIESFNTVVPAQSGCDANCEFLPHQVSLARISTAQGLSQLQDEQIRVGDYSELTDYWLDRVRPDYKRFRCLVPDWDNAARRRKGGAIVLHGSTPELYEGWLRRTAARVLEEFSGDERLLFINAWNEWGEGCYLEPDQRFGRGYLEATQRVLASPPQRLAAGLARERAGGGGIRTALSDWLAARVPDALGERQLLAALAHARPEGLGVDVLVIDGGEGVAAVARTLSSLQAAADPHLPVSVRVISAQLAPAGEDYWRFCDDRGIVGAASDWLAETAGDWLLLVEAGCEFTPSGLRTVLADIHRAPGCRAVFADEVWRRGPSTLEGGFRPDFNLDLLLSHPGAMAGHWLYSRAALQGLGGFDGRCGDAFELDVILRLVESGGLAGIGHVSELLLVAPPPARTGLESRREVLLSHLHRRGYEHADVVDGPAGTYRLLYGHRQQPLVSIVIPTRDNLALLRQCVESLMEKTAYRNYEILIVDNDSRAEDALAWLAGLEQLGLEQVRVLRYPHPFNYSAMNNLAARQARGEYLLLLNNDTAIIQPEWLGEMMNHAQRPEVGVVGARLLFPNGKVQHAGVLMGLRGPAEHPFIGNAPTVPGYMLRLHVDQNYSVVTAACLLVRKSVYEAVGGLEEVQFAVSFNDVDFCLKVCGTGHLVVWTPHAVVTHIGSISQKTLDKKAQAAKRERFQRERDRMYRKWLPRMAHDPAYNRNLSLVGFGFELDTRTTLAGAPASRFAELPTVLAAHADSAGCGHYRVVQPFAALRGAGLLRGVCASIMPMPAELERVQPQALVLQKPLKDEFHEAMRRVRDYSQAMLVYEIDDNLLNVPRKSAHRDNVYPDMAKRLRTGIGLCDRLVVSTSALAETFAGYHRDIRVVENRLPLPWWGSVEAQRNEGPRPRVGWAGGIGHGGDLELVADVVRELAGEVDWVFLGMWPPALLPHIRECYLGVETPWYPQRLASLRLDLAIAPLEDNAFNACKSNLRLLEYGACGYPVVCSDVRPYREHGLPVMRVRNRFRDWVDAIREHVADRDEAARRGLALQAAVRQGWMLEGAGLDSWQSAWLDR